MADGIVNGWVFTCPHCGTLICEFSLADEWFCECGGSGVLEFDEEDEEAE